MVEKIGIDELTSFCKRKGFVYPSAEIYGGLAGFWDFGHLGNELVNNIKKEWWNYHVHQRDDIVGIDGSIITNPKVWEASGHVSSFVDVFVVCKKCKNKSKIDKHEVGKAKCGNCGGDYEVKGEFNPMFTTKIGPSAEEAVTAYLRPETAQSIFVNFLNVYENSRMKLPFGIAQVGKAFRNEIAPREFLFRCREFEQMEIEYFIKKGMKCPYMDELKNIDIEILAEGMPKSKKMNLHEAWKKKIIKTDWHAYWIGQEFSWFVSFGVKPENFRARQHTSDEKSHYAIDTWDLEYNFPMGWRELQGFANRGDYDLKQHEASSKKSMQIFDEESKEKIMPNVVCEPSLGVGRAFILLMLEAYNHDKKRDNIVLKLDPRLAPYKVAVLPIMNKDGLFEKAKEITKVLRKDMTALFDSGGSIGKRYSRNDEIGTPYCIAVDYDTVEKGTVTIRDRDSTEQVIVSVSDLRETLRKLINKEIEFKKAGERVDTRKK